jgi:competence protein ComEA
MLSGKGENMKRTLTLLFALLLTAALGYAQATQSSDQSSSQSSSSSTTTTKSKKKQAKNAASNDASQSSSELSNTGSSAADAAKSAGKGVESGAKAVGNKTKEGYEASKDRLTPPDQKTDDSGRPQTAASNKSSTTTTTTTKTTKTTRSSSNLLDLNTATEADLTKLPGINAAKAQAIVANRPYHAKNQLVSKGVLSKDEYEAVKGQIIAHRATASAAKPQ